MPAIYLRWDENDYRNNTMDNFKTYLLNEAMVDVTLACDGLTLKAHKIILSSCSPFFQSIFLEHNSQHPIVILKDVKYTDLKLIIDFMYHGEICVREDQIPSLISTARSLKVRVLEGVEYDSDNSRIVIDVPDQSTSDTPSNFTSMPPTEQSTADLSGNLWMGSLLHQSEIKRSDSDIEDFNEDMDSGVQPSFTSTVPLETHEQGAGVNFTLNSIKESPSKFMEQTVTTGDEHQSIMQSNRELPNTFLASSTAVSSGIFDSHQLQNPSATSTVPVQTHNANSFHESQLEQPVEQGSDENFEPEPDLNESSTSDSKDSSVSNLVEYSLTSHDAHSSRYQSSVKPSVELPHTRSGQSSHSQSTLKSSIKLPRTVSDHSSQYQPTKKPRVDKPHTIVSHSSQYQSAIKPSVTVPHISSDRSSSYRVTLSSSDVLTVQTQQSDDSIGSCPKKIIVPKNMDFMRSMEQSSSISKQELKKKRVRFNELVQDVRSSDDVKKTAAISIMEKKSEDSGSRKALVKIGTNGTITRTEKIFRCKKCPFKSEFPLSLKKHINSEHEQTPKFKCDHCSFEASLKENLVRHTAEVHEPVQRFQCSFCPYKCDQQGHLKRHIESVHEHKKPFKCEICDFQSLQKTSLKKHVAAVHEKKKDFACDFCDYSCSRKGNLQRHVKLMHEKKKFGKETKKNDSASDDQD